MVARLPADEFQGRTRLEVAKSPGPADNTDSFARLLAAQWR